MGGIFEGEFKGLATRMRIAMRVCASEPDKFYPLTPLATRINNRTKKSRFLGSLIRTYLVFLRAFALAMTPLCKFITNDSPARIL